MTAQEHNRLLSIFFHIQGALQLLGGIVMVVMYVAFGSYFMLAMRDEGQFFGVIMIVVGVVTAVIVFLLAALDFFAAFKISKMQKVGRTLGIVLGIMSLFSFPVGTALGAYALWFFFGDMGKALYGIDAAGPQPKYAPPPPPNSWQ